MKDFTYMQLFKEQRIEFNEKYGKALVLFRFSDLFMAVEDDASECHDILGTSISVSGADGIKSSAFPSHCLDTYLPRLVRAGHRVCICENPFK